MMEVKKMVQRNKKLLNCLLLSSLSTSVFFFSSEVLVSAQAEEVTPSVEPETSQVVQTKEKTAANTETDPALLQVEEEVQEAAPERTGVNRIQGEDRYANAAAVSEAGWEKSDTVIVANGDVFADSLTGTALAGKHDAPVLLTRSNQLHEETEQEIERLGAKKVVVLGGRTSISESIEESLENSGRTVERFDGADRYEVAANIAAHLMEGHTGKRDVFLANGDKFADALSIAPVAARKQVPILLTRQASLHQSVRDLLPRINSVTIIGGTASISEDIEAFLKQQGITTLRLAGSNRYEVNRNIIDHYGIQGNEVYVASGEIYTDALPTAALSAKENKAMLLIKTDNVAETQKQLDFIYEDKGREDFTIVGGPVTISKQTEEWLKNPERTLSYALIESSARLNNMAWKIKGDNVAVFSQPALTAYAQALASLKDMNGRDVTALRKAELNNGQTHYLIQADNREIGWVREEDLSYGNRLLTHIQYYPQLNPNAYVGWGCAGAASAMLLSANGHTFSNTQLRNIMLNVPKKTDEEPYGQDGDLMDGTGFTQVVQPLALVPYLHQWDEAVVDISGESTDLIIKEVLNGNPVMYYGFTWSDDDTDPNEARNHIKVIRGYRDGQFDIFDPVYTKITDQAGFFDGQPTTTRKYDLGPVHRISIDRFENEVNNKGDETRPERQFITIHQA